MTPLALVDTAQRWRQVALFQPTAPGRTTVSTFVALLVAIVPILHRANGQTIMRPVGLGSLVLLLLLLGLRPRPFLVAVSLAGAGVAVGLAGLPAFGVLVVVDSVAALMAFGREPVPPSGRRLTSLPRVVVGASLLVSQTVLLRTNYITVCVAITALGASTGWVLQALLPRALSGAIGAVDRSAARLGTWVAAVATIVLVGPLVSVVWLVHRVVRFDPLWAPTEPGTNWVRRHVVRSDDDRAYAVVQADYSRPGRRRAHRALAGALVLPVLVGYAVVIGLVLIPQLSVDRLEGTNPFQAAARGPGDSAAAAAEPWFGDLEDDLGQVQFDWRTTSLFMTRDVVSQYVNVTDGRRSSWSPPPCDCKRLRVWLFGGSAIFGYFQRDDHTLASELARVADEHGITIDISNYGQPAYTLWQDIGRLNELLSSGADPPDLVLFMDGANELGVQVTRNRAGFGSEDSPASALDIPMRTLFPRAMGLLDWGVDDVDKVGPDPELSDDEVAEIAVRRYEGARRSVTYTLDGAGVAYDFAWQPLFTGVEGTGDEDFVGPDTVAQWSRMGRAASKVLPEDVLDFTHVLDASGELVFYDAMHLNERGARLLAEHWFRDLRPQLERLAGS